jgi:hypothetical protein
VILERARSDVEEASRLLEGISGVDERLAARMVPVLRSRVTELRDDITRAGDTTPPDADVVAGLDRAAASLAIDALSAYEGALARTRRLDSGLCTVAERLLDEVAAPHPHWRGLPVIPGEADSYTHTSGLIRLRFPPESVWGLPLVAHELGHHVAMTLTRTDGDGLHQTVRRPVLDLADEEGQRYDDGSARSHLLELFADVYATWVVGPAYLAALMALRLDPGRAMVSTVQHPAAAARVTACLATVDRLDPAAGLFHPHRKAAQRLAQDWDSRVRGAPGATRRLGRDYETVERRLPELLDICARQAGDARVDPARLPTWADRLRPGVRPRVEPGDRVVDVVSATWRSRTLKPPQPGELPNLAATALAACTQIAGGCADGGT